MKGKFICDVEMEVIESYDEALDDEKSSTETFKPGDMVEFDVIGHPQKVVDGKLVDAVDLLNIQFGDGSVAFGVDSAWFEEVT